MDVKSKGIEFEVRSKDILLGNCQLTTDGIVWCQGKKRTNISWSDFIALMHDAEKLKAAVKVCKHKYKP